MMRTALITGASSGLGLAIAKELYIREYSVVLIARDKDKLAAAIPEIDSRSIGGVHMQSADVGKEKDVAQLFKWLDSSEINLDIVINVAGIGRFGPADDIDSTTVEKVLRANLIGVMLMTSYTLRAFGNRGVLIVNVMSTAALVGRPNESVYCAAKWGARGFTEAARLEMKGTENRIVGVYPGGMDTPFWSDECGASPNTSKFMSPEHVASKIADITDGIDSSYVSDITINRTGRQ